MIPKLVPGTKVGVLYLQGANVARRYAGTVVTPSRGDTDNCVLLEDDKPSKLNTERTRTIYFPAGSDKSRTGCYQLLLTGSAILAAQDTMEVSPGAPSTSAESLTPPVQRSLSFLPPRRFGGDF